MSIIMDVQMTPSWVPWWFRHPPFRCCDIPTRTIRHCDDSSYKHLRIVTIQPYRGWTVRPPKATQFDPLKVGINIRCDNPTHGQSDPFSALPSGGGGQFRPRHTDGTVKKWHCVTREKFTDAWVSQAQAWPNITLNMARPTQQSSTSAWVNGVLLGGIDHTMG